MITEESGFFEYPKCYRTLDADLHECLFFEDLNQRSFSIIDKSTESLTVDHVNLIMKTLAKLHAVSFALKDQRPEKFAQLTANLTEVFFQVQDDNFKQYFNKQARNALDAVAGTEDVDLHTKLEKFLENDAIDAVVETLNLDSMGPAVCFAHGDTWQNNIMFKYDENKKPIEICLLDWQIARSASPIHDIVYLMFNCTTKELRDKHYDNFLKLYHDNLSAHIRRYFIPFRFHVKKMNGKLRT